MGAALIYGAYSEKNRIFSISIVASSKVVFVSLMLLYGQEFIGTAGMAIIMDCIFIILSGFYLIAMVMMQKTSLIEVSNWLRKPKLELTSRLNIRDYHVRNISGTIPLKRVLFRQNLTPGKIFTDVT